MGSKEKNLVNKSVDDTNTHWHEREQMVSNWLKERQSLIVLLCAVHGLREIMPKETPVAVKIQAFCQVLMDYVSAGHFEIYGKLIREADEFGEDASDIVSSTYPQIDQTTEQALAFNDKYETIEKSALHLSELNEDLSRLAESLSQRFDLEDQLIQVLHSRHRDQLTSESPQPDGC